MAFTSRSHPAGATHRGSLLPRVTLYCLSSGGRGHRSKHLCKVDSIENLREGEAPAEPTVQWFGRSLTLP